MSEFLFSFLTVTWVFHWEWEQYKCEDGKEGIILPFCLIWGGANKGWGSKGWSLFMSSGMFLF